MRESYPAISSFKDPRKTAADITTEVHAEYAAILQRAARAAEHKTRHVAEERRGLLFHMWTQRLAVAKVMSLSRPTLH